MKEGKESCEVLKLTLVKLNGYKIREDTLTLQWQQQQQGQRTFSVGIFLNKTKKKENVVSHIIVFNNSRTHSMAHTPLCFLREKMETTTNVTGVN